MQTYYTPDSASNPTISLANHDEYELQSDREAPSTRSMRLLRLPQVMQQTGLRKTKIYEFQKDGAFPMRIQITSHSVGWIEEEINAWITGRVASSEPLPGWGQTAL